LPGYREEFVRLLYAIIVVEFVAITILLFGFSNEYLSNAYMRTWISSNLPFLGILLHGEVDALFIGVALGAMVLLIQRRVQAAKTKENPLLSVKPAAPGYTSTSLAQNRTLQNDRIPDEASPSKARAQNGPPQYDNKELKKKTS
jgi:hypothetical protein